jgi:hypothetical protein
VSAARIGCLSFFLAGRWRCANVGLPHAACSPAASQHMPAN